MNEAAHYGYRGGLKVVEKKFGFVRKEDECMDGKAAIRFWAEYCETKSEKPLQDLLKYNQEDVAALATLASGVLRLSLENTQIDAVIGNGRLGFR